jgi:CheY-like chemotaxis protein
MPLISEHDAFRSGLVTSPFSGQNIGQRMGSPDFANPIWEKRMGQENVKLRLHLSNALIDCNRVSLNETPRDVSVRVQEHRILCVDDDVLGTHMRAEILKEHSYSVVVFHSPLEVTRSDLSTFNLAILDFEMPGLNGRELLLRIRAMGARFPIVLLTGCLAGLSHEDCVLFARCIDKSMPIHYLLDTIAEFLDSNLGPDYGS